MNSCLARLAVVVFVAGAACAEGAAAPLELPRDCALARGERPRLLFLGRDLPKLRERVRGPMKADFARFRAFWDQQIATDIQDHYKRWKDHADYEKWTTDPFRRSVVLGAPRRGGTARPTDQENPRQ